MFSLWKGSDGSGDASEYVYCNDDYVEEKVKSESIDVGIEAKSSEKG